MDYCLPSAPSDLIVSSSKGQLTWAHILLLLLAPPAFLAAACPLKKTPWILTVVKPNA